MKLYYHIPCNYFVQIKYLINIASISFYSFIIKQELNTSQRILLSNKILDSAINPIIISSEGSKILYYLL
jgi:hypothetical protein